MISIACRAKRNVRSTFATLAREPNALLFLDAIDEREELV